jgi:hypothetical protein
MSGNIREIIESHYCFCKVSPCYIGSEDRTEKGAESGRRVPVLISTYMASR